MPVAVTQVATTAWKCRTGSIDRDHDASFAANPSPRSRTGCMGFPNCGIHGTTVPDCAQGPRVTPTDKRSDLIDHMADFVLARGLAAASLRPLAAAAGISDRMLLYYFKDKPAVIAAVLHCLAQRLTTRLSASASPQPLPAGRLRRHLFQLTSSDEVWPYMQLWLEIAARAARGDAFFFAVGHQIGQGFLGWIAAQLEGANPTEALRLLTLVEGRLLLKSIGLRDIDAQA